VEGEVGGCHFLELILLLNRENFKMLKMLDLRSEAFLYTFFKESCRCF
jgi:hypothetical protein